VQVVLSTKEGAKMEGNVLPVSYSKFTTMVQKGDTIFLGRYLVTGSEESSCFLTVSGTVQSGPALHLST
jgi:pyruvate kinase